MFSYVVRTVFSFVNFSDRLLKVVYCSCVAASRLVNYPFFAVRVHSTFVRRATEALRAAIFSVEVVA